MRLLVQLIRHEQYLDRFLEGISKLFLIASEQGWATRRGAETEHSQSCVRLFAMKYGRQRPSRSPKENFEIRSSIRKKPRSNCSGASSL